MDGECLKCPSISLPDGLLVSGPGGVPREDGAVSSSPAGPFAKEAPQTGPLQIRGEVSSLSPLPETGVVGWAYRVSEAGTYGGHVATVGDVLWISGVNPLRWDILQSDADSALASLDVSFGCDDMTLSVSLATGGGATSVKTADLSCIPHIYATVPEIEAMFA